jgi:hypothetical protein
VRPPGGGGRRLRRGDAVGDLLVVAGEGERDERRAPVAGAPALPAAVERRLHVGDVGHRAQAPGDVADGGGERRVAGADVAAALDEHLLVGPVGEAGGGDRPVGDLGLPVALVLDGERAGPDRAAEEGGGEDEGEPPEDGPPAVPGAPGAGPRCDVRRGGHGPSLSGAGARVAGVDPPPTVGCSPPTGGPGAVRLGPWPSPPR